MDTPDPDWQLYRSFLAVLREASLSGAARRLSLAQPTLGRHIEALEQALGLALFTRSREGLRPTAAAARLLPYAEAMEATAAALVRTASAATAMGVVRITASEVVGAEVLPPILAALRAAEPTLVLELVLSNRVENLLQRGADIAVRMVRPHQEAIVVRRIGTVRIGLFARREYLERCGTPENVAALRRHALIGFDHESPFTRSLRFGADAASREMFALRTDSDLAQLAAVRAGFGIGGVQAPIARRDPSLIAVLPGQIAFDLEVNLAMHEDLRTNRGCRAVFDALGAGLVTYLAS